MMSKATYPLKLPMSIKKAAQRLAKEDGLSLNQWIAAAVAKKIGVVETAAEFFAKGKGKASGAGMMKFLRKAPKWCRRQRIGFGKEFSFPIYGRAPLLNSSRDSMWTWRNLSL